MFLYNYGYIINFRSTPKLLLHDWHGKFIVKYSLVGVQYIRWGYQYELYLWGVSYGTFIHLVRYILGDIGNYRKWKLEMEIGNGNGNKNHTEHWYNAFFTDS